MKCYCYETDSEFIFCVEDVENMQLEDTIKHKAWEKIDDKFVMSYQQYAFSNRNEKELIKDNFTRLGQAMFESSLVGFNWEEPLDLIAQKFAANGIEWYIIGSVCDTIRGINVKPSDIDIVVHTRDFHKAKDICYSSFADTIIAPFKDIQGMFALQPLRCFGRMFLDGALVEIAADENWNLESRQPECEKSIWRDYGCKQPEYVQIVWRGYDLYVESLQHRHQIETSRNRADRIKAINEYMNRTN